MSMMTGYTACILNDNADLKTYLLNCARAYIGDMDSYEIEYLNNHYDRSIKYYQEKYDEAQRSYQEYLDKKSRYTDEDKLADKKCSLERRIKEYQKNKENILEDNRKYNNILEQVKNWDCSQEYDNLKTFACQQILNCIDTTAWEDKNIQDLTNKLDSINNTSCFDDEDDESEERLLRSVSYYKEELDKAIKRKNKIMTWYIKLNDILSQAQF